MDKKIQWAFSRVLEKLTPNYFGDITITFHSGKPIKVVATSTDMIPKELRD
jgi:hypothetical protein